MQLNHTTHRKPTGIWQFKYIGSQEALLLAERISTHIKLEEDEEGAELLIRLVAGITAACADTPECRAHFITRRVLTIFFAVTQKSHDAFFDYVVRDLEIARDHRAEGDEPAGEQSKPQPEREIWFESTLARIAYIIGKTRFLLSDQCEIADDEALGRIRDLVLEMEWRKEGER
jgi:hypothetical protein